MNVSDGRDYVQAGIAEFIESTEDRLVAALRAAGHEGIRGVVPISTNALAAAVAREHRATIRATCDLLDVTLDEFAR
ncbi:hypothetical protein ACW2Q0_05785 [Nocardia sp. R16R-3T]